jgi:hypothetical protein
VDPEEGVVTLPDVGHYFIGRAGLARLLSPQSRPRQRRALRTPAGNLMPRAGLSQQRTRRRSCTASKRRWSRKWRLIRLARMNTATMNAPTPPGFGTGISKRKQG